MSETADLFRAGLKCLTVGDLAGYLDLFSEDVDYEFPFAPAGRPGRVSGRENLREYLELIFARSVYEEMSNLTVYETNVDATIVAEMTMVLRVLENDRIFSLRYIVVVRSAGGRIVSYRDYWNPLAMSAPVDAAKAV
jgi:ketosteroid isomerase-like protein